VRNEEERIKKEKKGRSENVEKRERMRRKVRNVVTR
jgi:hypothetical protein